MLARWESWTDNHWHSSRNAWPLCYDQHTVCLTNWPFYLNCVRTGVSIVTSKPKTLNLI